ncbi:hypothetical protein [Spiroplasma endosymbiont of Othius punctulatus]|uniref:hypothetical protein n=1 Tax=Spiroplasma endosymbiont of Othius punctulatus TaxID=3066289 RepID=UPI0030CDB11B
MNILLGILGTISISSTVVAPTTVLIKNEEKTLESRFIPAEKDIELSIDNLKFMDGTTIKTGIESYKEEMINFIEEQRLFVEEEGIKNLEVISGEGKFPNLSLIGDEKIAYEIIEKLINAESYEVKDLTVEVKKQDNLGNFHYLISLNAISDGEELNGDLYSYKANQSLADFHIMSGYNLTFSLKYDEPEAMDYTDRQWNSGITMPYWDTPIWGTEYLDADLALDLFNSQNWENIRGKSMAYINQTLDLGIYSLSAIKITTAKNVDGVFQKDQIVTGKNLIKTDYFYVTTFSDEAKGNFDILVKYKLF